MIVQHDYQIFSIQQYGGVSRYHVELLKRLDNIEACTTVLSVKYSDNEYLKDNLNVRSIAKTGNFYLDKGLRKLVYWVNRIHSIKIAGSTDIVHLTWTDPYLNLKAKGKIVVTIHDMIHEIFWSDRQEFMQEISRKKRAIYESDAIIAISQNTKEDILKFYPDIPESKITVIYHGTNHLPLAEMPREQLPKKYILYVGRRDEYKGFSFLVNSVASYLREENIYLVVVGGQFTKTEYDLLKRNNLEQLTISISVIDAELAYLYQNAICFIYPSDYEGFGFPILEAFDNGCPVICTDVSSLPEVGGGATLYFQKDNKEELLDRLKTMVTDKELRQAYVNKGKERVKLFTWEKCAIETYQVYQRVLAKKKDN